MNSQKKYIDLSSGWESLPPKQVPKPIIKTVPKVVMPPQKKSEGFDYSDCKTINELYLKNSDKIKIVPE